jgi:hypothetical protein
MAPYCPALPGMTAGGPAPAASRSNAADSVGCEEIQESIAQVSVPDSYPHVTLWIILGGRAVTVAVKQQFLENVVGKHPGDQLASVACRTWTRYWVLSLIGSRAHTALCPALGPLDVHAGVSLAIGEDVRHLHDLTRPNRAVHRRDGGQGP